MKGRPAGLARCRGARLSGVDVKANLARLLPDSRNTVVLVGFQPAGTRSLSVHADHDELVRWLGSATNQPESVFLVHGDAERSTVLPVRRCALASTG